MKQNLAKIFRHVQAFPQRNIIFCFTALWLALSAIGIYIRTYPLRIYVSDDAHEKASLLVIKRLQKQVHDTIDVTHAHLPPVQRKIIAQTEFSGVMREQRSNINKAVIKLGKQLDATDPPKNRYPHLLASDSYYYYSLTKNIEKTGAVSGTIKGSKYLNPLMLAPVGFWEPFNLHPYLGFFLYKLLSVFNPGIPLEFAVGFLAPLVAALTLIPFLLFCRQYGCSWAASFVGGFYLSAAPVYLRRSMFGWYDNDPYNVFFPMAVLAFLFFGLKQKRDVKSSALVGVIGGLLLSVYALFWQGWVFLLSIIGGGSILILFYNHFILKEKNETKRILVFFAAIFATTFIGISVVFGPKDFFALFREGLTALRNFINPQLRDWPDLYIGVGELRAASLMKIIYNCGGIICFTVALLGLAKELVFAFVKPSRDRFMGILLIIFFFLTLLMSRKAERFCLLFTTPAVLLFTLGVQTIFTMLRSQTLYRFFAYVRLGVVPVLLSLAVFAGLLAIPCNTTFQEMQILLNPLFNQTWETALLKLKKQSPPGSIVNTWWSPGHFIKAIAERAVTFDGATISSPQAYWLTRILLSTDEKEALGRLRMLNGSSNLAVEYLQSLDWSVADAVDFLEEITLLNKQEAAARLSRRLDPPQTQKILGYTHKEPPPSYFLIYEDMMESYLQLAFIDAWDFRQVEEAQKDPQLKRKIFAQGVKSYVKFVWDMGKGQQPRHSGFLKLVAQSGDDIILDHNVKINLKDMRCSIDSPQFGKGVPYSLFYQDGDKVVEKKFSDASLSYSAVLLRENVGWECALLETDLARSLIARLYYFDGAGLQYIKPAIIERNLTGRTQIEIFEVDWDRFLKDMAEKS